MRWRWRCNHIDSYGAGRIINKLDNVIRQRFSGDVNVFPHHTPAHLLRMFSTLAPRTSAASSRTASARPAEAGTHPPADPHLAHLLNPAC